VLESYSKPLLQFIEWRPSEKGDVEVLNDTGDYYRYFDATPHAEFLYRCVEETVERDLPEEVAYLEAYDRFTAGVQEVVACRHGPLTCCTGSCAITMAGCRSGRVKESSRV
jgi:hypothetical protein